MCPYHRTLQAEHFISAHEAEPEADGAKEPAAAAAAPVADGNL